MCFCRVSKHLAKPASCRSKSMKPIRCHKRWEKNWAAKKSTNQDIFFFFGENTLKKTKSDACKSITFKTTYEERLCETSNVCLSTSWVSHWYIITPDTTVMLFPIDPLVLLLLNCPVGAGSSHVSLWTARVEAISHDHLLSKPNKAAFALSSLPIASVVLATNAVVTCINHIYVLVWATLCDMTTFK